MRKAFFILFVFSAKYSAVFCQKGCPSGYENGQNLITNPNFEKGLVGFDSDYKKNNTKDWFQGSIYVTDKPAEVHNNYRLCLDSNYNSLGKMLVVDGAVDRKKTVWQQKILVKPGAEYYFSFFFATLMKPNPAQLEITINDIRLTKPFDYNYQHCKGSTYFCYWNAGISKEADIKIKAYSTELMGNDFALDDIQFFSCTKREEKEVVLPPARPMLDSTILRIKTTSSSNAYIASKISYTFEGDTVSKELLSDSTGISAFALRQKDAYIKIQAANFFTLFDTLKSNVHYSDSITTKQYQLSPLDSGVSFTLKKLTFERYSSTLEESSKAELLYIVDMMLANPSIQLAIQGHTDNQGDALKNYTLSLDRVRSVKTYLVEKGVEESRLNEAGFGGTRPLVGYGSDEERKVNRRVEFVIIKSR